MPGIFERLGSFGRSIMQAVARTGRSILETVRLVEPIVPDVTPAAVIRDFGTATRLNEQESIVSQLPRDEVIADHLHVQSDVPFKRDYAYTVTIQGRAVAGRVGPDGVKIGGRFTRDEFNITSNRRLTPEEVENIAYSRFGAGGTYALVSIRNIAVTAAMSRE